MQLMASIHSQALLKVELSSHSDPALHLTPEDNNNLLVSVLSSAHYIWSISPHVLKGLDVFFVLLIFITAL